MNIFETLAKELNITLTQVEKTVALIDEGNTIPFIARYRKEVTGSLDDTLLRDLDDRLTYLRNIEKRKQEVKDLIAAQEKLTEEIEKAERAAREAEERAAREAEEAAEAERLAQERADMAPYIVGSI